MVITDCHIHIQLEASCRRERAGVLSVAEVGKREPAAEILSEQSESKDLAHPLAC